MEPLRNQSFLHPMVILTGIPGLESRNLGVSISFCFIYILALLGNSIVLLVIMRDRSLHKPMYLFLCMLAVSELGVSLSTLPTVLGVFLLDAREIGLDACLSQMFFIHCFSSMESGVLWAMALDRFIAIYNPLQYTSILTNRRIILTGSGIATRSIIVMGPLPVLLRRLPFCRSNVLAHPYCMHPDLIRLPCADTMLNSQTGLFCVVSTFGFDSLCILLSYMMIIKTVLNMTSRRGHVRALNTCISHICAVVLYYSTVIGLAIAHRFGQHDSPMLPSLMANIYLLVPPILNPIIYSIKTKEIRKALGRLLYLKKF